MPHPWNGSIGPARSAPTRSGSPRRASRHELEEIVATAPGPIRVAGAGHSFSAGAVTDGTLLSLDALDRVLDVDGRLVRVEAGIRLKALSRELHVRGLAMPNLGDIDAQSLAGALATGTHGTGTKLPNLSGQLTSVELIDADGRERTISGGDELLAARVSLGALGVIAAVTVRCVPAFRLRHTDRPEPLEPVLEALQERADAHDHFEFWTFPHADVALTRTLDRTEDPPDMPGRVSAYVSDVVMDNHAFRAVNEVAKRFPRTIPAMNRFASKVASQRERVDWSHAIFASERLVRFEEMEYSVPREQAVPAVQSGPRRARAPRGQLPDRAALQRGRRRAALARPRPRQRVRRRPRVPGHAVRARVPRGRGRAVGARRAPALGQAQLPHAHGVRPALPALGRLPAHPRGARPGRPLRQRLGP